MNNPMAWYETKNTMVVRYDLTTIVFFVSYQAMGLFIGLMSTHRLEGQILEEVRSSSSPSAPQSRFEDKFKVHFQVIMCPQNGSVTVIMSSGET